MIRFMLFPSAVPKDLGVEAWLAADRGELGVVAARWFNFMRSLGSDVRELLHDGCPTACVDESAFAYVNAFQNHLNVGFFLGTELRDPSNLMEGTGKFMRHVKLWPGKETDAVALESLIEESYEMMRELVRKKPVIIKGDI